MRTLVFVILGMCLVFFAEISLKAKFQGDQNGRAAGFEKKGQGKQRSGQLGPRGNDHNRMPPKPFLMAGDPRFQQMLKLTLVDKDKLDGAIEKWPSYQEMSDNEKRRFVRRVDVFRDRLRDEAMKEAEKMNLQIPDDKQVDFLRSYWSEKMVVEQELREQIEKEKEMRMKALRQKLKAKWSGE